MNKVCAWLGSVGCVGPVFVLLESPLAGGSWCWGVPVWVKDQGAVASAG